MAEPKSSSSCPSCLERVPPAYRRVWRGHMKVSAGPGCVAKTSHPRRGGCPHPPGRSGARAGGLYVSSHRSCPSGPRAMWASPPTRISGCCRSTEPGLIRKGSPPHPALRGHLLQAGEGMGLLVLGCRKIYGLSHSSWPGSLGGLGPPHPSGPMALPPSPWGKATSRRGMLGSGKF